MFIHDFLRIRFTIYCAKTLSNIDSQLCPNYDFDYTCLLVHLPKLFHSFDHVNEDYAAIFSHILTQASGFDNLVTLALADLLFVLFFFYVN